MAETGRRRVQQYVEEYRRLGDRFSTRYGHPTLLRREDDVVDDDEAAFHTAFMRRDILGDLSAPDKATSSFPPPQSAEQRPSEPPAERAPAVHIGEFFEITKRAGSAFPDRIGIGRARNADVCIVLPKISKYHAFFSPAGDGSMTLTDAGSKNGTFIDGVAIPEKVATPVRDGAEVCFGPYRFTFYTAEGFVSLIARRAALR